MAEASTQKHMLPVIRQILAKLGPTTRDILIVRVQHAASMKGLYFWPPDFHERLQRMVARGQLVKFKKPGDRRCWYALPDNFPTEFNLNDPTARLVASDKAEETGHPDIAELLRTSKEIVIGKKKETKKTNA